MTFYFFFIKKRSNIYSETDNLIPNISIIISHTATFTVCTDRLPRVNSSKSDNLRPDFTNLQTI